MGHGREENNEAGGGAEREACQAQPVARAHAGQVVQRADEPAGERLRRGRGLHLHGAVPPAAQGQGLIAAPTPLINCDMIIRVQCSLDWFD